MTNIILWVIAGGAAGWIGYTFLKLNEKRGLLLSIAIGMFGGFLGGRLVAPMIGAEIGPVLAESVQRRGVPALSGRDDPGIASLGGVAGKAISGGGRRGGGHSVLIYNSRTAEHHFRNPHGAPTWTP